jgi:hypothetical protein
MILYHIEHNHRRFLSGDFAGEDYWQAILQASKAWNCNPRHLGAVLASGYYALEGAK